MIRSSIVCGVFVSALLTSGVALGTETKFFCEYGYASAPGGTTGGAEWDQTWGVDSFPWFECEAEPDVGFLNSSVHGTLSTTTTGATVDLSNLILTMTFVGTLTLVAYEDEPAAGDPEVAGTISGHADGAFIVDLSVAQSILTADTILIPFGKPVRDAHPDLFPKPVPDALIGVTETTGKFQSIQAEGPWAWDVAGWVTIQRLPGYPDEDLVQRQVNIFAALRYPSLILRLDEEIALSGAYHRA